MFISKYLQGYNTPIVQIVFLGLVCLCCPGMFNALSGLGAGGSMSSNVALTDAANGALYGCFAIVGFFAGSVTNTLGVKYTLTVSPYVTCYCANHSINLITRLDPLVTLFIQLLSGYMIVNKCLVLWLRQAQFSVVVLLSFGVVKVPS